MIGIDEYEIDDDFTESMREHFGDNVGDLLSNQMNLLREIQSLRDEMEETAMLFSGNQDYDFSNTSNISLLLLIKDSVEHVLEKVKENE